MTHVTPSFSWPVTRMTRDPWPSPRPWHESITTTHESWWVHDYCLLFSAMMCNLEFRIWLIQCIFLSHIAYSKSSSLRSTWQLLKAEHGKQFFFNLNTSSNHGSSVLRYWPVTNVTHSHLLTIWPMTHWPIVCSAIQWTVASIAYVQNSWLPVFISRSLFSVLLEFGIRAALQ